MWNGEGNIRLNMVDEELVFYTRWNFLKTNGKIEGIQEIQVKGLSDIMLNQFTFSNFVQGKFIIELENQALGKITGTGLSSDKVIAWEFRIPELGFEGFEFYELDVDGTYKMRAEYATRDQFRTLIQGKVWIPAVKKE